MPVERSRPTHPAKVAIWLMIGVTLAIALLALVSASGSG